jgi:hypothetical protein
MLKFHAARMLPFAVFACAATAPVSPQNASDPTRFVIDANRAFIYLRFDHIAKGPKRSDAEPDLRIWLRLVNNCNVPIDLRTYGTPEGGPTEEVGVMDEVVENPRPRIEITASSPGPETTSTNSTPGDSRALPSQSELEVKASPAPEKMPDDYWYELGSGMTLQPGKEVLFSIPVNQLGKRWHIQIPFSFEGAKGKFPRDPEVGGEPEMHLSYSLYDLPDEVQAKVKSQIH